MPAIAQKLRLPTDLVAQAVTFLVSTGLCVNEKTGLAPGPQMTHLPAESPLVARHHGNWRVKAMERHPQLRADELAYTAAMSLSARDTAKVRDLLLQAVERTDGIVGPSRSERVYCMNIDWFEIS